MPDLTNRSATVLGIGLTCIAAVIGGVFVAAATRPPEPPQPQVEHVRAPGECAAVCSNGYCVLVVGDRVRHTVGRWKNAVVTSTNPFTVCYDAANVIHNDGMYPPMTWEHQDK